MPPRKRLGQLLTELGVIDEHQLQSALGHQKQWGGKLGSVLVQKGFCKEPDVVAALSKHLGMPQVKLAEAKIDPRAIKFVSKQIAEKLHVIPYELSGSGRSEVITVAMSDPTDLSAVDQLAFHTGKRIKPMLAGDSEIIQAIQMHYGGGEEKKPLTTPAAGTAPAKPAPAPGAAPAAPSAAPAQFPRRIDAPTPAGGSPRPAPYIPPPIPTAAPKPEQKLEEIEPDESMSVPTPPPPPAEPVDLPEDDGEMMGLEPIAAHSQFGDEVAGAEEVDGSGSAADAVEGLESASVKHEGVEEANQMEGLEPIAAHSQEPAPDGGWGADAAPAAEGWGTESAPASWDQPAEAAAPSGWGDEAAPAADAGWTAEAQGEQLPIDAILGTAETAQQASGWETPSAAAESPATEEFAAPPVEEPAPAPEQPAESAEAPDAWASSEDPLAAAGESAPPSWGESAPQETSWGEPPPQEEAAPAAAPADETAPEEPSAEDRPITDRFATEPAQQSATAETEAPPEWGEAEEQPAEAAAEESATAAPAEESPPAAEEPVFEEPAAPEEAAAAPEETSFASEEAAAAPEETSFASEEAAAAPEEEPPATSEETPAAFDEPAAPPEETAYAPEETAYAPEETAAAPEETGYAPEETAAALEETGYAPEETAAAPEEAASEEPPSEEFPEGQSELKIEGWIAAPPEPAPQGTGWFGQQLQSTAPLSAADLGTLASIGVDPNDGVAALRLLAAVVRVLNRHQTIDPTEIALEIHESRAAAAAESAAAQSTNGEPEPETSETEQVPAEPAET